jgi:chemotaxis protein methyltransferase CheR
VRARDAQGAAAQTEAVEIDLLLTGVATHLGYDFRGYTRAGLRRRVRQAMLAEGVSTVSALQERVLRDPAALARFVETVAVQRAPMFANPEMYLALRREVVPLLRTYPFVAVWIAGCSTGEELYSLAIVLHEQGLLGRCRLYATDVSETVVERARLGRFPLGAMADYAVAYQRAGGRQDFADYYHADREAGAAVMAAFLRPNLIFSQHNLVCDGAFNEFQLVVCRNLIRQFDPPLRARVHEVLHASLQRLGVLALGTRESLRGSALEEHYRPLAGEVGLYRRVQ